jgi:hypothetical protein
MAAPTPRVRDVSFLRTKIMQPALTSHYEVYILPPPEAKSFIDQSKFPFDITDLLTVSCTEATLPGSQLGTHDLNNDFTGVTQRHAYRRIYDDRVDFTFYVNGTGYDQIRYFEAWMRYISGEQVENSESRSNFYRIRYPQKYKSETISITKFERNKTSSSMTYKFINAFPISVTSMPLSYDSSQLLKCTVSFSYDRYVAGNIKGNVPSQEPSQSPATGVPNPNDISYAGVKPAQDVFTGNPSISGDYFNNISPNRSNQQPNEYYNNFGQNSQNATNFADFTDGSNTGPFGQAVA